MPDSPPSFSTTSVSLTDYYAGFWLRAVAYILDVILILAVLYGIFLLLVFISDPQHFGQILPDDESTVLSEWVVIITITLYLFFPLLYFALMESSSQQATLGKMIVGIKVTDLQGRSLTFSQAIGRNAAKLIPNCTCPLLIAVYIVAGFTEKKQALHDMMAGTLVLKKSPI